MADRDDGDDGGRSDLIGSDKDTLAGRQGPPPCMSVAAMMTFGGSFNVMKVNAWEAHWQMPFSHELETLYWLLEMNGNACCSMTEIADMMQRAVGAHEKTTKRDIKRAADKKFLQLAKADALPAAAGVRGVDGDGRARYPLPTPLFVDRMRGWADLNARVHLRTYALASYYANAALPKKTTLPSNIDWDIVAWQRNQLPTRGRK